MQPRTKAPFSTKVEVIFRDIDALGHVNSSVYFTYMETARTKFFMESLNLTDVTYLPIILANTSCTYRHPARLGDRLRIDTLVTRIGTKSFNLTCVMRNEENVLIAEGESVLVYYDYANNSARIIPLDLKELLSSYQIIGKE